MQRKITEQVYEKLTQTITLEQDTDFADLAELKALDDTTKGSIRVYRGDKIEKCTLGEISMAPGMDYCSVTLKPRPEYEIPRLGINYMVAGDTIQFDVDLYPPMDLVPRQEYVDTYYDLLKETYLAAKQAPHFAWRVSDHSWMRLNTSPYFFMSACEAGCRDAVDALINAYVDVWLKTHAGQERVGEVAARAMQERRAWLDRWLREREPERHMVEKVFGVEMTHRMSKAMI